MAAKGVKGKAEKPDELKKGTGVLDAILRPKMAAEGMAVGGVSDSKGLRPKDGVPDMTHISDIDVAGINENLAVRYKRDEIYTYSGTILVAVNPYKFLPIYENVNSL